MVHERPQDGQAIKAIRKASGRTQEELADAVGIDQSYLSLIESDNRVASDRVLKAIADTLNVPVRCLLKSCETDVA